MSQSSFSFQKKNRSLFSPAIDLMLAGGIAWIVLSLLFLLVPPTTGRKVDPSLVFHVSIAFAVLSYVVNYPHFMASYALFYKDYAQKLRNHGVQKLYYWRSLWAGVLVPILLMLYFAYGFAAQNMSIFAIGVKVMFFTVGWHYVKQAFGVFIMLNALKRVYYSPLIRRLLLINCMLVWMLSWLGGNIWVPGFEQSNNKFYGVSFSSLGIGLPPYIMQALRFCVFGYGVLVVVAIAWQAWKTRTLPSLSAIAGYSTMYTLLLYSRLHPLWIYMTPLLHSAQYLLFVAAYKKGELADVDKSEAAINLKRYLLLLFWAGILSFTLLPKALQWATQGITHFDGLFLPFTYAFIVFINVHHYFIDNVVWRKENVTLHAHLKRTTSL